MKSVDLLLLRHAKSSWDDPDLSDFDRPLNKRGRHDAPRIGAEIARRNLMPDFVLCSSAQRTRETFKRLTPSLPGKPKRSFVDDLYLADEEAILGAIATLLSKTNSPRVMVIGHNPGLEDLAELIADPAFSRQQDLSTMKDKFPTAALAVFRAPLDHIASSAALSSVENWRHRARLLHFIRPRDLANGG